LFKVAEIAKKEMKLDCEVIDLVSILPWDKETVCEVSIDHCMHDVTFRNVITYYSNSQLKELVE